MQIKVIEQNEIGRNRLLCYTKCNEKNWIDTMRDKIKKSQPLQAEIKILSSSCLAQLLSRNDFDDQEKII